MREGAEEALEMEGMVDDDKFGGHKISMPRGVLCTVLRCAHSQPGRVRSWHPQGPTHTSRLQHARRSIFLHTIGPSTRAFNMRLLTRPLRAAAGAAMRARAVVAPSRTTAFASIASSNSSSSLSAALPACPRLTARGTTWRMQALRMDVLGALGETVEDL
jgi:hypothetical protein